VSDGLAPEIAAGFGEVSRYLQDEIPPEAAAPVLAGLLSQSPETWMRRIGTWATEQSQKEKIPVADFLLYGLGKIYIVGERELLDRDSVANFLDAATTLAVRGCPVEDRERLRFGLTAMRESNAVDVPRPTHAASASEEADAAELQAKKRLSMILERLGRQPASAGEISDKDLRAAAQILTMAASSSKNSEQLNDYLEQVRKVTGGKGGNAFAILGGSVAEWDLPRPVSGTRKLPAQVAAMGKIIDMAENPAVALERLRELLGAAIEKFNLGSLAAAMWMFDVAESGIKSKKLEPTTVERIRTETVDKINQGQLRKYVENASKHTALRIALEFFPSLRLAALFRQLRGETRAERRRSILGLMEIHGEEARARALAELEAELKREDVDTYYLRNAIYILHRIPRESEADVPRQLAALGKSCERGQNIYVIKEAALALGQIKNDASVKILTTCLAEIEVMLLRSDSTVYPLAEMQKLVDRIVSSIGRIGTPAALLTVARHGMKSNALLGDTRGRLGVLAQHDLSFDEQTVDVLLKAIREELPGKFLGRLTMKKNDSTVLLIEALSGTRSEAVDEMLVDLAGRFAALEIGQAASAALGKRAPQRPTGKSGPAATLAGELEFFGLPAVMQSLASMAATGILTLSTKQGQVTARIVFFEGMFLEAQMGHLRGIDALYQYLERPVPGTFAFVPHPIDKAKSPNKPRDMLGLLFEGVRRQDELQELIALIPDDMVLTKTDVKPTPADGEKDPTFIREVWIRASSGSTLGHWESEVAADSFRIRTLVAHWIETGALTGK